MTWRLTAELVRDHEEIPSLLNGCVLPSGAVDLTKFDDFRHRLLRHIAIEERVLRPALVKKLGAAPLFQNGLRKDHAGIAALCVPTPNREWVENLKEQLEHHNRVEEGEGGFYELVEQHLADDPDLPRAIRELPAVTLPPFATGRSVRKLLRQVLLDTGIIDADDAVTASTATSPGGGSRR